jgi:hypothetical protein
VDQAGLQGVSPENIWLMYLIAYEDRGGSSPPQARCYVQQVRTNTLLSFRAQRVASAIFSTGTWKFGI